MLNLLILFCAKYLIFFLFLPLIYFWFKGERRLVFRALVALVLAEGIALLIKTLFPTPRPFVVFGVSPPPIFFFGVGAVSFPSCHTAIVVATAVSVMLEKKLWGRFLLLLALAVGIARVLALAHFWWDILGGAVLGTLCAFLANKIGNSQYRRD